MHDAASKNSFQLIQHIRQKLDLQWKNQFYQFSMQEACARGSSAVLLAMGPRCKSTEEPCLILNKRSRKVRQAGDLCFPGGSIEIPRDRWLSKLISLPGFPMGKWRHWPALKNAQPAAAHCLALLLATGLRESMEEMRLNPFGVKFLGPLPPQHLVMFKKTIYPLACWIPRQQKFYPNWEVEKLIRISLADLLTQKHYRRLRLMFDMGEGPQKTPQAYEGLCYHHADNAGNEYLWGATLRITMAFLESVFDFHPPVLDGLQEVNMTLGRDYLEGDG